MNLSRRSKTFVLVLFLIIAGFTMLGAMGYFSGSNLAETVMAEENFTRFLPIVMANEGGTTTAGCYRLAITHKGDGSYPIASPDRSPGCQYEHTYHQGQIVELSGAVPAAGWHIDGWVGTVNDSATAVANSVVMPSGNHMAGVQYVMNLACYDLALTHSGQGSDPLAAPLKSATCPKDNSYVAGEKIQLSGAVPAASWFIAGWNGTDDDSSTAATNTVIMPAANHTVEANYAQSCYTLTLSHTGQGSDPVASPEMSAACTEKNKYVAGETIALSGAVPDAGWHIGGWSGTDDDAGITAANTVTLPAADHTAAVNYAQSCYRLMVTHAGNGVTPVAAPEKSAACTEAGTYMAGETIQLSGAAPDAGWHIVGWTGTDDDTSLASSNTVTMPPADHTATVIYEILGCYRLSLTHTGNGTDPTASPLMSEGCTQDYSYIEGQEVLLNGAVPDAGWFIDSWTNSDDDSSTSSSNKVTMPAQNRTVTVNYSGTCYTLTRERTGQGSVPAASPTSSQGCSSGQYTAGELIDLSSVTPATGWHIAGWTGTNNNSGTGSTNSVTMPPNNHTVQVNYLQSCYALTIAKTGQGSTPTATVTSSAGCSAGTYHYLEDITLTGAVPSSGWEITGWIGTNNNSSTAASNVVTMTAGPHTAQVVYSQNCYQLTIGKTGEGSTPTANPTSSSGCSSGQYHAGQAINLSGAAPSSGWHIAGWTGTNSNGSTAATNTVTMPATAHTASVVYEQSCYQLTIGKTGEGTTPTPNIPNSSGCSSGQYHAGQAINLSGAAPSAGWHIAGWTGTNSNGSTAATNTVTMPAATHSAGVVYEENCYQLTIGKTGEGSTPAPNIPNSSGCSSGQYHAGQAINLSGAAPSAGWHIAGWTGTNNNGGTTSSNTVTMPATAHTASVVYEQSCYQLTIGKTGEGTAPTPNIPNSSGCSSGQYHAGQAINLSGAAPSSGWHIAGWTGTNSNGSTAATNTVTMPAATHSAGVVYEENCYQLTIGKTGEGSTPAPNIPNSSGCSSGQYHAGQAINLSGAAPSAGWFIAGWTGTNNNGGTTSSNTVTMPATAHTASVVYEQSCYQLTIGKTGEGTAPTPNIPNSSGCSSGQYHAGQAINLSGAAPSAGWHIAGWTGTNSNGSTTATNTVTMPAATHTASVVYAGNQFPFDCISSGDENDTVGISNNTSGNMTPTSDDVVAAFTDDGGLCTGKQSWNNGAIVTVWGDNGQTPVKDGMTINEEITWRVWDYSNNAVCTATATYDPAWADGTYHDLTGIHKITALAISCP